MRTFLAIELPDTVLDSIHTTVLPLQSALPEDFLRWVPIENMHVTIKFLGKTDRSALPDIKDQIMSCCRDASVFDLDFGGLGAFPSQRRPRVLWIGARGGEQEVSVLHGCVEVRLEGLGFERENRSLHLHVTWGRVRRGTPAAELRNVSEELSRLDVEPLGGMRVDHLTLFESNLGPTGAQYRVLERFRLGPG